MYKFFLNIPILSESKVSICRKSSPCSIIAVLKTKVLYELGKNQPPVAQLRMIQEDFWSVAPEAPLVAL